MKDFAVRIWDSKNKEMVIITDLTLNTFYKLHTGENQEEPMLASPFYDTKGVRLFENDIVMYRYDNDRVSYDVVKLDESRGWIVYDELHDHTWQLAGFARSGFFDDWEPTRENAVKYEKVGNIYTHPDLIQNSIKEYHEIEEAKKREKELQCLMKLKEKYECEA
jgi:hypothetical protein